MSNVIKIFNYKTIDSTNEEAKRKLNGGEMAPFLIMSGEQTSGKGRKGRSFYSPKEFGVYFTLSISGEYKTKPITVIAAAAVLKFLEESEDIDMDTKKAISVKWVNDILKNDKKICGVLTELYALNGQEYIIIGIGINLYQTKYPKQIESIAGAIFDKKRKIDKKEIAFNISNNIIEYIDSNSKGYMNLYRKYCNITGKKIIYDNFKTKEIVEVLEITNEGMLVVKSNDEIKIISSGEISVNI